jgi:hypothetical protein
MGIADKAKIEAAIKMLRETGHSVQTQMRGEKNTVWFEIDRRMLASWEEMENLADWCVFPRGVRRFVPAKAG